MIHVRAPSESCQMAIGIGRRQFMFALGSAAAWPIPAHAQSSERMRLIGVLRGQLPPMRMLRRNTRHSYKGCSN
jgi:hypothetical protein